MFLVQEHCEIVHAVAFTALWKQDMYYNVKEILYNLKKLKSKLFQLIVLWKLRLVANRPHY